VVSQIQLAIKTNFHQMSFENRPYLLFCRYKIVEEYITLNL